MIPIRHTLPRGTAPIITRCLVATNVSVFLTQLFLGSRMELLIQTFGFIPGRLVSPSEWHYAAWEVALTLFTSLFIHGGFVHLLGNMIYLWVFGDAVEDALGHLRFLLLYLFCGAFGSLCHTVVFPLSHIPSVGASGSIAGVLGAFFVLRPRARIVTLFPLVVDLAMAAIRRAVFPPVVFLFAFTFCVGETGFPVEERDHAANAALAKGVYVHRQLVQSFGRWSGSLPVPA